LKARLILGGVKIGLGVGERDIRRSRDAGECEYHNQNSGGGSMHADLVKYWMRNAALVITPIAPHFAEYIHCTILKSPTSIQRALWPTPERPVDPTILEAAIYMRDTVKTIRDAEAALLKMLQKVKGKKGPGGAASAFDPKKPKSVRIYVATSFPEWQDQCVQVVKEAYDEKSDKVDDTKVKVLLTECGLIKDKRAMPFIQAFKKRMTQFGAQTAFRRALPFSERQVLAEILPHLTKTLGLVDAEVLSVDEAKQKEGEPGYSKNIIDTSEPGNPAFEYRNV